MIVARGRSFRSFTFFFKNGIIRLWLNICAKNNKYRVFVKQNVLNKPCCLFKPTIEEESNDAVVTMHPLTAMKNRLFRDIPFIMGVVQEEGLINTIGKF